jgi:hypothetical protein
MIKRKERVRKKDWFLGRNEEMVGKKNWCWRDVEIW